MSRFNTLIGVMCGAVTVATIGGCATESSRAVIPQETAAAQRPYAGPRQPVSVGKFDNRSSFMRGVFSEGVDRLVSQDKTIMISHLNQSNRFSVLDRENMTEIKQEAEIAKESQTLKGARFVITGDVTEFGRKEVGDHLLFGILGSAKQQIAYSKVTLKVVNVKTAEVVYSAAGAGEYSLSNREVIGFGGTASYDSTLNGKVLDLAIRQAVDSLVGGIESGAWQISQ